MHSLNNILLCRLTPRTLLIIRQNNHIFTLVLEPLMQESRHVLDIIDAPSQLSSLTKVIDTDQERLALPRTRAILVPNLRRSRHSKGLLPRRWCWRCSCAHVMLLINIISNRHSLKESSQFYAHKKTFPKHVNPRVTNQVAEGNHVRPIVAEADAAETY